MIISKKLWLTNFHHCLVIGERKYVMRFAKAFRKHQGQYTVRHDSKVIMRVDLEKICPDATIKLDNQKFNLIVNEDNITIGSCLTKFLFKLKYQLKFRANNIVGVSVAPSCTLLYDLLCLRIILPACSYELLKLGWIRIKASSFQRDDRVILLPGFSGDGKTTFALKALKEGETVLNDTFTYISREGVVSASANPIQIFKRNFKLAFKLIPITGKVAYMLKIALTTVSLGKINLSHQIYYECDFSGFDVKLEIKMLDKYMKSWVPNSLIIAVDWNENNVFYNLLNVVPMRSKMSLLDAHTKRYRETLSVVLDNERIRLP